MDEKTVCAKFESGEKVYLDVLVKVKNKLAREISENFGSTLGSCQSRTLNDYTGTCDELGKTLRLCLAFNASWGKLL